MDYAEYRQAAGAIADMTKQQTVRAHSSDIRDIFEQWVTRERTYGARLVVVEGLMKSGKSKLISDHQRGRRGRLLYG
jgi:hypothetical protein